MGYRPDATVLDLSSLLWLLLLLRLPLAAAAQSAGELRAERPRDRRRHRRTEERRALRHGGAAARRRAAREAGAGVHRPERPRRERRQREPRARGAARRLRRDQRRRSTPSTIRTAAPSNAWRSRSWMRTATSRRSTRRQPSRRRRSSPRRRSTSSTGCTTTAPASTTARSARSCSRRRSTASPSSPSATGTRELLVESLLGRGLCHLELGNTEFAVHDLQAVMSDPQASPERKAKARLALLDAYARSGNVTEVLKLSDQMLGSGGRAEDNLVRFIRARALLEAAKKASGADAARYRQQAMTALDQLRRAGGGWEEKAAALAASSIDNPAQFAANANSPFAKWELAKLLVQKGDYKQATPLLEGFVSQPRRGHAQPSGRGALLPRPGEVPGRPVPGRRRAARRRLEGRRRPRTAPTRRTCASRRARPWSPRARARTSAPSTSRRCAST